MQRHGNTGKHYPSALSDVRRSILSRAVIRFVSSLLHKMIDSLAPSVTNFLVRGKTVCSAIEMVQKFDELGLVFRQVTIGIFGHEEIVIDKPVLSVLPPRNLPHEFISDPSK